MDIEKIKKELIANGTTKAWLAKKVNLSRGHLTNILNGRAILTKRNLFKIKRALR